MEFEEIDRWNKASPGEYVYHTPTKQIGLCGKFDREADIITIIAGVNIITDSIKNFKKIKLNKKERQTRALKKVPSCGKCGK
jgi:hypothetical protein